MPDWSYHPLFKPLFFRLEGRIAQRITYAFVEHLGTLPFGWGKTLIRFMGHMQTPPSLQINLDGLTWISPVGLASGNAVRPEMIPALQEFGFGGLEFGPIRLDTGQVRVHGELLIDIERQGIGYSAPYPEFEYEDYVRRIALVRKKNKLTIPVGARLLVLADCFEQVRLERQFQTIFDVSDYVVIQIADRNVGCSAPKGSGEAHEAVHTDIWFQQLCEMVSRSNQIHKRPVYL